MTKKVLFGDESRAALLEGVKQISNATRVTMGASGRCVLVGGGVWGNDGMIPLPTRVTKDGVSVCREFKLEDAIQHRGAMLLIEAAEKTVYQAGDGTTCTVVLADALISEGVKFISENKSNPQQIKRGMEEAIDYVVSVLKKKSTPVRDNIERVRQVATVSANNDNVIGNLIADAVSKIGYDGVIDIERGSSSETKVKVSDGFKFDRGMISHIFVNKPDKDICEFEEPVILMYDKKINHHTQVEKALSISNQSGRPLLIICEDAEGEGLAFLAINNYQKKVRVCVVKCPEFGDAKNEWMEDIALLTGGVYISDIRGVDIKKLEERHLGRAKKIIVSKTETVIIGGDGAKEHIEDLLNNLKMNKAQALQKQDENEVYAIEKRIARLSGGVAVIEVGANTETELNEKLDRVDDAVRATKSAISEGFLAGGGTALFKIERPEYVTEEYSDGYSIVFNALKKPLFQICENAGVDPLAIAERLKNQPDNTGYNVLSERIEDMVDAGIIDSTKAIRCALVNAASVAGMFLTSECSIITIH